MAKRLTRRRTLRAIYRFGCAPALLIGVGLAMALSLAFTLGDVPIWVPNPRSYRVGRALGALVLVVVGSQMLATWWLGLHAAVAGANAAAGGGANLPNRLRVAQLRALPAAWGLFALRVLLLALLALAWLVAIGAVGSYDLDADDLLRAARLLPWLLRAAAGVAVLSLLIGPFLRLRYSATLGALAGALAERLTLRGWLGASARLGAGLVGVFGLLWGTALATLAAAIRYDSTYSVQRVSTGIPGPYDHLAPGVSFWLYAAWGVIILGGGIALGQLVLPPLLARAARRALARRLAGRTATAQPAPPV